MKGINGMKGNRKITGKSFISKRTGICAVSVVLVLALVVSMFTGIIPIRLTASAASGSGLLTSLDGENTIPASYTAVNVPAGTRIMEPGDFNDPDAVPSLSDGIAAFDFHIFADRFAARVHTCGNIAVNELGYDVLGVTGAPEFGSRAGHDLDVARVSYIGKFNSWTAAATADYFVFGPEVKITNQNGQVKYGSNGDMMGNDNNGSLLGKMYIEDVKGSFIDISSELTEAEKYMRYLVWLQKKAKGHAVPFQVELGDGKYTMVQYVDGSRAFDNNGKIDFSGYTGADTIVVDLSAADAQRILKGNITMNGTAGKRIVFNVNNTGTGSEFKLNDTIMTMDGLKNCEEVANYDNNIIWNFYKLDKDGVPYSYDGVINVNGTWIGTINAPAAKVKCYAGLNGSIIANQVTSQNETHKADYTGERVRERDLSLTVHKIWDDDPSVRPDYITLRLKRNDVLYKTVQVTARDCTIPENDNFNWYYTFSDLPATDANGKTYQYKVEEVSVPGYQTSQMNNTIYNFSDYTPVYYSLTVNKVDGSGKALPDAVFELTGTGGSLANAKASGGYKDFSATAGKVTWKSTGSAVTISNLPQGSYTVTEISAPAGYQKAAPVDVTLSGNKEITVRNTPLAVQIEKLNGSANNAFLPGSTFTLTADNGKVTFSDAKAAGAKSYHAYSDRLEWISGSGTVTVTGIPAGTYTVTEDKSPDGYDIAPPVTLVLSEDGTVTVGGSPVSGAIQVTDYLLPEEEDFYSLSINKKDKTAAGGNLSGAQLELISVAGKKLDSKYDVGVTGAAEYEVSDSGKVSFTTGSSPVSVTGLPGGSYILHEVSAPQGRCLANDIPITLNEETADTNGLVSVEMIDRELSVSFIKADSITGNDIANAKFKVEEVDSNGTVIHTVFSEAYTPGNVAPITLPHAGTYRITELAPPAGYYSAAPITFIVDAYGNITNSNAPRWDSGTVTMYDAPCELKLFKNYWNDKSKDGEIGDDETGMLSGAELVLTATTPGVNLFGVRGTIPVEPAAGSGTNITAIKWTSGSETNTLYSVPNGSYTLTETSAPDGYAAAPGISFDYSSDGSSTNITNITSLGSTTGKPENAPIVGSDGFSVGIYDKKVIKHEIDIQKINELGNPLPGAFFAVYPKDSDTEQGKFDPDKSLAYFESGTNPQKLILPDGEYYLVETLAPEGYKRIETAIPFTVDGDEIKDVVIPDPTPAQPVKVGEVSATLMPKSVLADTVTLSNAGDTFSTDGAEYLVIDLSEIDGNSAIQSVSVHKVSGSGEPEAAAVSGITCGSFTADASDSNTLTAALTDTTPSATGKYLVIAEVKNNSAVDAITFDKVSVTFANGGSATIAKTDWGYDPGTSSTGGGGSGDGTHIIGTYVCDKDNCEVTCYPADSYSDYLSFMQDKGFDKHIKADDKAKLLNSKNHYLVVDITEFADSLSQNGDISKVKAILNENPRAGEPYGYIAIFTKGADNYTFVNNLQHNDGDAQNEVSYENKGAFYVPKDSKSYIVFTPTGGWGSQFSSDGTPIDFKSLTLIFSNGSSLIISNIAGEDPGGEEPAKPAKDPTDVDVMTTPQTPQGGSVDPAANGEPPKLNVPNEPIRDVDRYVYGFNIRKVDDSKPAQLITDGTASFAVFSSRDDRRLSFTEESAGSYKFAPAGTTGTTVDTIDTSAGVLAVSGLEEGSYYIYEIAAPENYILSSERKNVTLPDDIPENDTLTVDLVNTRITGELLITKLDNMGGARSGAKFGLFNAADDSPVYVTQGETVGYYTYDTNSTSNVIVTGDSGHITVTGLPLGGYYVKETEAPAGCAISDSGKLPVNDDDSRGITLSANATSGAFTVTDTAYDAKFAKADRETGELLEGAVLELTPNTMSSDPTRPVFAGVTALLETEHHIGYEYRENSNEIIGIVDEKLIWTSSAATENIIYGLPAGEYTLTEVTPPVGYGTASPLAVTVSSDGKVNGGSVVTMLDDAKSGSIKLAKYDSVSGAPLDGAKFILKCGAEYVVRNASTGEITFVTDKADATEFTTTDGVISVINLPFGKTYTFEETEAPLGYRINAGQELSAEIKPNDLNKELVAYNDRAPAKVVLNKTDTEGNPVNGAEFVFYRLENGVEQYVKVNNGAVSFTAGITEAAKYPTQNGRITIENLFPWGYDYYAVEVTVPDGYINPQNNVTPLECSNLLNYSATVTNRRGGLAISKVDGSSRPLAGASLSLARKDGGEIAGVSVASGTLSSDRKKITWLSASAPVSVSNIPTGTYVLTENSAPTGYALAAPVEFTVNADGSITGSTAANSTVVMTDAATKVFISKKAVGAGTELPGASLKITPDSAAVSLASVVVPEGVIRTASEITWISGNDEVEIGMLPVGSYTLTEVTAPNGYDIAESIRFSVEADGTVKVGSQKVDTKTVLMEDAPKTYVPVYISKKAVGGGNELPGASLTVKDSNNAVIDSWVSGSTKHLIKEQLSAGTYTLTEVTAPNGYEKAESITFVIDKAGKITVGGNEVTDSTVLMEDAVSTYNVYISKVELGGGDEISGAELTVTDSKGNVVDEWTSTDEKHLIKKQLTAGTYTLTEVTAPKGYKVAESMKFTVDSSGVVRVDGKKVDENTVIMEDAPNELVISKQAVGGGKELEGAVLKIVPLDKKTDLSEVDVPDGVKAEKNLISWTSGKTALTIGRIPEGVYTFTEITAPSGYDVAETIYIMVDEDGVYCAKESEYKEENTKWNLVEDDTVIMYDSATILPPDNSGTKTGSFSFIKTSSLGKALSGAEFTLTNSTGEKKATSAADGKVVFADIPAGTYTLAESKAPTGYTKASGTVYVTVSTEGAVTFKDNTGKALQISDVEKCFVNNLTPVSNTKTITDNKPVNLYEELVKANSDIKDVPVKWNSSDPTVADVDSSGNVTFKKPGNVTITAKNGDDVVGSFILGVADSAIDSYIAQPQVQTQGGDIQNVTVPAATPTTVPVVQVPSTSEQDNPNTGERINLIAFAFCLTTVAGVTAWMAYQKHGKKREENAE